MWTYSIPTGVMSQNGKARPEQCYSGIALGKNNPEMCSVADVGPIPPGKWKYGAAFDSDTHGPLALPLTALPGTETYGRSGFLIHGDSIEHPGFASHGCIIAPRVLREAMNKSQDRVLEVVE